MIDLHLHTTASDGRSTPDALVREAAAAGVHTLAVTDHDTVAGLAAAADSAQQRGITFVPGIEITAVDEGRDVHVLGYFFDPADQSLAAFLTAQRADRRRRLIEMGERLAALGLAVDLPGGETPGIPGRSLGRPLLAQALVDAGHARDIAEAFSRYLSEGRPAFVARRGADPAEVVAIIRRAGGLASVAHPAKQRLDGLVRELAKNGLAGVEVFHPDHGPDDVERFSRIADECGLVKTGGSDYHGPGSGRSQALGWVGLSSELFDLVLSRAGRTPLP